MTGHCDDTLYLLYRFARYRAHVVAGQCKRLLRSVASGLIQPASNEADVRVEIGPVRPDELPLIHSSWKHSALDAPQNDQHKVSGTVGAYFTKYNRDVRAILATDPLILVAREATDPSFAYGWICAGVYGDELAIFYVYTKYKFRRLEIARTLKDAVLERAADDLVPVYCAKSVHDRMFERWGFEYRELHDVIGTSEERRAG